MEDDRMARPEVTGRRVIADQLIAAFSIREFCAAHRISQSMYFKLRNMGLGPREMSVGTRKLISLEAAAAWRRTRERAKPRVHPSPEGGGQAAVGAAAAESGSAEEPRKAAPVVMSFERRENSGPTNRTTPSLEAARRCRGGRAATQL